MDVHSSTTIVLAWSTVVGWLYSSVAFAISYKFSPALLGAEWETVKENERPGWHSSFVGFVHACILPYFAFTGFMAMWHATADCAADVNTTNMAAPRNTVIATGMTTGYFLFDFCNLLYNKKKLLASSMKNEYYVMLVHHILSVLIWPWAVVRSLYCWWINYFLVTEVTNIGLNARSILINFERFRDNGTVLSISMVWAVAFLFVRIVPVPVLAQYFMLTVVPGCDLNSRLVHALALTMLPIPVALNCYWFSLIVKMAMKKLFPKPKSKSKEKDAIEVTEQEQSPLLLDGQNRSGGANAAC